MICMREFHIDIMYMVYQLALTLLMILAVDTRGELISRRKRVPIRKSPIPFRKPSYYQTRREGVVVDNTELVFA